MNVNFDGNNRLIIVNEGVTVLDVQTDLYSDWKKWMTQSDNAKYPTALRTIGGDPTVAGKIVAPYFFLTNGWKIRPYEGNHVLNILGNLFVDEPETYGQNIAVPTVHEFQVLINMATTSDATIITPVISEAEEEKIAKKTAGKIVPFLFVK